MRELIGFTILAVGRHYRRVVLGMRIPAYRIRQYDLAA